jgi:hypothetical protein
LNFQTGILGGGATAGNAWLTQLPYDIAGIAVAAQKPPHTGAIAPNTDKPQFPTT